MSLSFEDICNLKVGDVLWESCNLGNIQFTVISEPYITDDETVGRQVTFDSETKQGAWVQHLASEKHMHYNNLYWEPAYSSPEDFV